MNEITNRCSQEEAVSCQWGVLASAYFDNELEPTEKVSLSEEHLFSCPECNLDLEALRTIQMVITIAIQSKGAPLV